jgi:hypothetical protein
MCEGVKLMAKLKLESLELGTLGVLEDFGAAVLSPLAYPDSSSVSREGFRAPDFPYCLT